MDTFVHIDPNALLQIEKPAERYVHGAKADPLALVGGLASSGIIGLLLFSLPAIAALGSALFNSRESKKPPFEYIEARLLKQGEIKDKKKMPDRVVPALPTAPEDIVPLDQDEYKKPPEQKPKPKRQVDAAPDNKLREVFDKARAFAEIQDNYVPEGDPSGVPEGEVTDPNLASIGATYGHKIKLIFLEYWIVPTLLSDKELAKLSAKVSIKVDVNMRIVSVDFLRKSNNRMFDDSVQNAIDQVRTKVRTLPPPPEAIASNVYGGGINMVFNGKEANQE